MDGASVTHVLTRLPATPTHRKVFHSQNWPHTHTHTYTHTGYGIRLKSFTLFSSLLFPLWITAENIAKLIHLQHGAKGTTIDHRRQAVHGISLHATFGNRHLFVSNLIAGALKSYARHGWALILSGRPLSSTWYSYCYCTHCGDVVIIVIAIAIGFHRFCSFAVQPKRFQRTNQTELRFRIRKNIYFKVNKRWRIKQYSTRKPYHIKHI